MLGLEDGVALFAVDLDVQTPVQRRSFCPACAAAHALTDAGFSRTCPACGAQHFPRTDPAVIVLVEHDGNALLGRQAGWPRGQYSVSSRREFRSRIS